MNRKKHSWVYDFLFLLVFILAGWLRLTGVNWGEGQHQHPDENFLAGVLGSLSAQTCVDETVAIEACPEDQRRWMSIGEYFDSKTSTLNPYNRGYSFFVYGNLPMTMVRIAADAAGQVDVKTLGRQFSAMADLFTILFLYLLVSRLYGRKVGLLASLFSALTVMQIQQSHFFTTDLFVNMFAYLAIWFAVEIVIRKEQKLKTEYLLSIKSLVSNPLFLLSIGFGLAFGMALASKVNIYPLAVLLPGAFALRYLTQSPLSRREIAKHSEGEAEDEASTADDKLQTESSLPLEEGQGEIVSRQPSIANYYVLIAACLIIGGLAAMQSL
jgi:hypothetical protein